MATCSLKTTAVADGLRLILFRFYLGVLSGIGDGFDSLGDRIHSLPTRSCVNILGHGDIRVTHVVPPNLRPCAFAQPLAGMQGAEVPKIPSIARIGRV